MLPLFFQISYLLVTKLETCHKYFMVKKFQLQPLCDSNNRALSSSDVLGTYVSTRMTGSRIFVLHFLRELLQFPRSAAQNSGLTPWYA